MISDDKLKKVYNTLRKGGYTQDYGTFKNGFLGEENYENRKKVYDLLTANGAQIGANYHDFLQKLRVDADKEYFKLRRGGRDFTVSRAEVEKAGGLQPWAQQHPGAPLRVYMHGKQADGSYFDGHTDATTAAQKLKNHYWYTYTTTPIGNNAKPVKQAPAKKSNGKAWKPSAVDMAMVRHNVNTGVNKLHKIRENATEDINAIKKGGRPDAAMLIEREPNTATGKMERRYYTEQGAKVASRMEQSRRNNVYNQWWENNTEEGKRSKEQRLQREFERSLSSLWSRIDATEASEMNAAERAWKAAEARQKAAREKNAERNWGAYSDGMMLAGPEMRTVTASSTAHEDLAARYTNYDLDRLMDDAWNNLGAAGQKAVIDDCYRMLARRYPGADGTQLREAAQQMARQQSDLRLYELAVEKKRPKSELDYLMRKIGDMNLLGNITKGMAVWKSNKTGDMAAYEMANEQYRQDGHMLLDVVGNVLGFMADPTTYISGGVGGVAGKAAVKGATRAMIKKGTSAAVRKAFTRKFANTFTGRLIGGVSSSSATFGFLEGAKELENQFAHGGKVRTTDDEGNLLREGRYVNEGYSGAAVAEQALHGMGMGAAIGWLGPTSGNVSDYLVRGTKSTAGKVMTRAGVYTGATIAEGTIFSVPEWLEGSRDAFDVWTDNLAMMVGFKGKHIIKSAGGVLKDLKASFSHPTDGRKNRLDFESRVRMRMDAPTTAGIAVYKGDEPSQSMALTKDERAELKRYGYDIKELTEPQSSLVAENAPEIVDKLTEMVRDQRVSEAARAKMYYYATGRRLPMSTVMRGELYEDGKGGFRVESIGANGVITSRSFKHRKNADIELKRIKRQVELNSIELGEQYKQAADLDDRMREACRTVAEENGWEGGAAEIYRICVEARENHLRGNDKELDEAQQLIVRKVVDAMGDYQEGKVTDELRASINEKYGVDIDDAIRKEENRRKPAEQQAIEEYINELFPKEKENPVEDVDADDITNQKMLTDEPEQPNDFTDNGPVAPRFDNSDAGPEYDPHQPGGEQKPVGRAVMKYQDRPVEVLSGRVVMMEDGTMVDNERSDETIVIRDLATGEIEMVSPDAILSYEDYVELPTDEEAAPATAPETPSEEQPKYTSGQIKIRNSDGTETRGRLTGYVDENGNHEYYVEGDLQHLHYASEQELNNILSEYQPDEPQQPSAAQPQAAERVYPEGVTDTEAYDNGLKDGAASTSMSDEDLNRNIERFNDESEASMLTDYGRGWVEGLKQEQQRRVQAAQPEQPQQPEQVAPIEPTPAPAPTPEPTATPTPEPAQAPAEAPQGEVNMPTGVNPVGTISVPQRDGSIRTFTVGKDAEGNNIVVDDRGFMWAHDGNGNAMQPYSPGANVPVWTDEQLSKLGAVQPTNEQPATVPNQPENVLNSTETPQNPTENAVSPAESVPNPATPVENVQETPAPTAEPTPLQRIPRDAKGEPIFEQAENPEHGWDALVEFAEGDAATAKEIADTMAEEKRKAYEKAQKQKPKGKTPTEILASKKANAGALAQAESEYNFWQKIAGVEKNRHDAIRSQQEAEARLRAAERAEAQKAEREANEEAERREREASEGIPEMHLDTPENARKRGARRYQGEIYKRQEPAVINGKAQMPGVIVGRKVKVKFANGIVIEGHYVVSEVESVQPSHIDGKINPKFFLNEGQPKDRTDAASVEAREKIATNIDVDEITGGVNTELEIAYIHAPVTEQRREIIQGNNRWDALLYLWSHELPKQQSLYRDRLISLAPDRQYDVNKLSALKHPTEHIVLEVSDEEAIHLGQMTMQDIESGGIERIKAKNAAQKMGDSMQTFANLLLNTKDEDATFGQLVDLNGAETLRWMNRKGIISNTQYQSAFDSKGALTPEAKNDLQKVLYQSIFKGGSQQLEEMFSRLPAKAQRAILSTAFRDMSSPEAGKMLPEIQSSVIAFAELMGYKTFAEAKNLKAALAAVEDFKRQYALDDRFEQYMPADNFSNFALHLAAFYKAGDVAQRTLATYFNNMFDLAQGRKEATLYEPADTTPHPLADVIKQVFGIDYEPAKNGKKYGKDGSIVLAVGDKDGQGGERGSATPPAGGERAAGGTEPSERGGGTADDSRGVGTDKRGGESEAEAPQTKLSKEDATDIIAKMEMSAVNDPQISLSPESWQNSFGLSNSIDTPLGKVKMGEGQYQKFVDKKRSAEFGMVVQTLQDPDVVFIEPSEAKEGQATERDFSYVFVKTFIRNGQKFKYYTSVSVLKDGMEVSVSSHIASKTAIMKKLQGMERAYTKQSLLPNSSEWHLAEHPTDVPDLLPTQGKSDANLETSEKTVSDRKVNNSASEKQVSGQESSVQPSDSKGEQTVQTAVEAASAQVNTTPTPAQAEAGNYKKGHVTIGEFDITIENPAGSVRKGVDADGKEWSNTMANTYGYIKGTEGVDGDHIDVFLHSDMDQWNGRKVFVVDQTNRDGSFDEHKVMLGFNDKDEAMTAYLANYDKTWADTHPGLRISETNIEDFNKWVQSSHRKTKPFADYTTVSKVVDEAPVKTEANIGEGYKIESNPYTNKQGKTLDTYLVTFDRDFSKEELSALRAKAKALKGWYDRESKGWMLRSSEDAKAFAEEVTAKSEDEVADEAPLSMADMEKPAAKPKKAEAPAKPTESPMKQVDVEGVFDALKTKGETKLNEHATPAQEAPKPKKSRWISDEDREEFDRLHDELRRHFGKDDIAEEPEGGYGKPQPRQMDAEVLRMGTRMTYLMMKGGLRSFADYCEAMKEELPEVFDEMRPHLKSLYAAAQNMEEVIELGWDDEMDDRKTVKAFDVYNFDKPGAKDIVATAQHVVDEQASQEQTSQIVETLKDKRNDKRRKEADATSADSAAVASQAEAVASQTEGELEAARTEQGAAGLSDRLDKEIEKVNGQLALLGYYEADTSDPSKFHESYGYMLTAEKKALADATRLTQQLAKDLGIDPGKIKSLPTRGKAKKDTFYAVRSNLAPACGDISIRLPLGEDAELYMDISVEPAAERGGNSRIPSYGYADNLEVRGGYFRVENPKTTGDKRYVTGNRHFTAEVTYDDLLADIRRDTRHLLPEERIEPGKGLTAQPGEDYVAMAERVAKDNETKQPQVAPEQTMGDLFAGLTDDSGVKKGQKESTSPTTERKPINAIPQQLHADVEQVISRADFERLTPEQRNEIDQYYERGYHLPVSLISGEEDIRKLAADDEMADWMRQEVQTGDTVAVYLKELKRIAIFATDGPILRTITHEALHGAIDEYGLAQGEQLRKMRRDVLAKAKKGGIIAALEEAVSESYDTDSQDEEFCVYLIENMGLKPSRYARFFSKLDEPTQILTNSLIYKVYGQKEGTRISEALQHTRPAPRAVRKDTESAQGNRERGNRIITSEKEESKDEERTEVQSGTEGTGRGRQQPRPNEPLGESAEHEDERPDGRGVAKRSGVHTVSDSQRSGSVSQPHKGERSLTEPKNTHNNHAERGVDYAPKGEKARIDANIAAIELARKLLNAGATATPKEMVVLRRYSGWGGLGAAFKEARNQWERNPINERLRQLLTPEEYYAAVMSRNSAYYTPAPVIDAMWDIAKALGFKGGSILEGSAGIGNIIGLMPVDISGRSSIHAVEIDNTTGGILSLLYPDAKVEVQGFEKTKVRNGSVDLAITNVPFVTGLHVMDESGDSDLSKKFRDIHDFCIAKNVRKLRDGGIGIFITSSGTLDKSQKLRSWLVGDKEGNADVVGVFRMNNQTFGGTAATSDIIVVRKRVNGRKSANAIDVSTVTPARTATFTDARGKTKDLPLYVNRYFIEHPEHMGGEMFFGFEQGDTYRPTSIGLFPTRTADQAARMAAWVQHLADMDWSKEQGKAVAEQTSHINEALGDGVKEGSMVTDSEGNLCVARMGRAVPLTLNKNKIKGRTKEECFKDYTEIKSALADVLKYQTEHDDDAGLQPLLDRLNRAYDTFVQRYGNLNKNNNLAWLRNDVDFSSIVALETYSEKGNKDGTKVKTYGKTDIFSRRVVEKESEPTPKNVKDGIIASIYKYGRIDTEYLATQLGKPQDDVKKEIVESGLGFVDPTTGQMEVSYEYLSGNVREKLRQAREANEAAGGAYDANVKALEAVVPMNIPAHLIEFSLGSSWIEPQLYERYVKERTELDVKLTNAGGTWHMAEPWKTDKPKNTEMGVRSEAFGILIPGHKLIEAALTNKTITVSRTVKHSDGGSHTETDPAATTACATKVDEIRQDFKDWAREQMQNDPALSMRLEEKYNEKFNNSVPKTIPDDFVPSHFGGAATVVNGNPFQLRPHQAKAVIRATTQPVLLAHEVGTGKTYTLITTAMEMRRLGTARKPMIVVQNATVGQFVASAKALYPNAKVLTLEDADRKAEGRRAFYAKIKFNDWDMIVVPQSVFERIPDSIERQTQFIQDKIEEKMLVLEKMKEADPGGKSMIVRSAEREISRLEDEMSQLASGEEPTSGKKKKDAKKAAITRQNAEVKARELLDRATDDVDDFDSMGIDAILVDEAHEYKHLGFATAMQRGVKGVDPSPSKKSQGVFLKAQAVLEKTGGKNVVFATGTPISNTAAEIWTFMRYLMPADVMKEYDIYYFDDFVRNFGNLQQMLEFKTNGKFDEVNRFAGYVNLPELVRIWSTVADTVLTREAGGVSDKIPQMEGGKAQDIFLPQTRALRSIMKFVKDELKRYEGMTGKEKKENSHIPLVMYGIAKAAAVDARLVQSDAEDDPNSKTNEAVRQTLRSLEETKDYKGTVAIFADNYQNKTSGFNLYEDIRKKLIAAGVPEEQVVVMKSGMTVKKKLEIFDRVNAGEVRVVMGSTFTLGTGVNIQERLHTLIHLDAPNRPMDYTQRNGRILRQGNLHKTWGLPVRVLRFGVEDSLDVTAYQRLKTKGAIADSIMNGKQLMANSMENRSLEEDQDLFGDITAQLSGSEYAMLKNQTEKEVRKLRAAEKNWKADQTYIHNRKRQITGQNREAEKRIADDKSYLEKVEAATIGDITVGKLSFPSVEAMEDFFTEQNKKKAAMQEQVRTSGYSSRPATSDITISVGGFDFKIHTEITKEMKHQQGDLFATAPAKMTYSCPELGIDAMPVRGNAIKNAVLDIMENVVSGKDFRERIAHAENYLERNNAEFEAISKRDGQPFKDAEALAKAEEKLAEYEELMKAEMAAKEAKYAEMDKEVEAASGIELTEEDSEPTASEPVSEYSAENANFVSRYETKDGKAVRYTSENPEAYGGLFDFDFSNEVPGADNAAEGGRVNRRQQSNPPLQRRNAALLDTNASARLNEANGEYCALERKFRESNYMEFTSAEKVESADDVAFIFEELENASVENVFVVMTKRGVPTVMHISIGGFNWSAMNAAPVKLAYDRIKPDKVYFVHNHPSGALNCSPQDVDCLKKVESAIGKKAEGVIMDLKSGKYGTFDSSGTSSSASHDKAPAPAAQRRLRLYAFDRHVFNPDYQPSEKMSDAEDVAKFLSSHRLGDRSKVSVLVCNNQNQIVANVHTTHVSIDSKGLADDIIRAIGEFGGMHAFLYGDFEQSGMVAYWNLSQAVKERSGGVYNLLDVVRIEGNHTWSARDNGYVYEPGTEYGASPEGDIRFREVEDDAVLKEFAEGKTVKAYRTMQVIDGKLYSPMATKVGGKATPEIKLGVPEQAEEHPEIIKRTRVGRDGVEVGYVVIDKGLGKGTLEVAYNPSIHASLTPLNDQFTSADIRPNLVIVETLIPKSELTSGYRAPMAKDAVGEMSWHSGTVSGKLAELGKPRRVILSRYDMPVRIVPFKEVAKMIAAQLEGTDIAIPYNVVTPQVRMELPRLGIAISDSPSGRVGESRDFGKAEYITDREIERINAHQQEMAQTSPEAKSSHAEKLAKKFNTPIQVVTDPKELKSDNADRQARMRRSKGFYDPATGKVVVVLPNNANVEDVAETVFHEVVAHKGLREIIGEDNYDAFCDEIYDHLEDELKQKIDEETTRRFMNDPAKGHDYHRRVAVDEMFGRMSEKGFEDFTKAERGLWKKLKKKVLEAINKFLGSLKLPKWVKLGDNELRYILWRSHERLRSKGDYVDMARDAVKREELGLNDKTKPEPTESEKRARAMSRSKREFESTRDRAIREKGIVTPGLNDGEVRIVRVGQHLFSGDKPIKQAEAWAKANIVGLHTATDSRGDEFEYSISKNKIEKQLSVSAVGRSENLGVHLAALTKLPEIISESIEAEIHPDYKKGADGRRKPENGVNNAALIHRFYGAAEIDGKIYRVKTTMEEFVDDNRPNTPHSFEVTKIELLEAPSASTDNGSGQPLAMTSNNSNGVQENASSIRNGALGTTKLLENVEKSYDAGKKLLDESGLAEEPTYEYRFRDGETGDIWNDQSIGFEERITNAAIRLSNNQSGDLTLRNDAMRAIGGNLTSLRRAMAAQKRYDQATVKRVADLARILMQNGYLSDMTSGEMQRLISAVKNAVGHTAVKESVQKIMDIMVNNQLRNGEATLRKLLTIRGSKVDARGVEVQGALDVDGQRTLEVVKKAMGLTEDDIANRIAEALNRMSDPDQTIADQAALEYAGLNMALDYVQNITASKADEKALRDSLKTAKEDRDAGRMTDDAYKQFVEATEDAIRKNKVERAEAYINLVGRLSDSLRESIENAKAFREAEKARVSEIHHNANSDMEGRPTNEHHKDNWKDKFVNNGFVQFLFAPLGTFDQILRVFGNKSANGEGYLWNRFMRGWVDCRNKELLGVKEKFARLDEKAAELFGKGKTWGNLIRMEEKMPKATVSFWDGGEMRDHELTQGNLLYIYMVDKMTDGRMKLRRMGITEDDITRIENFLDPRFKALGDWLQDEFLVDTRNEYNETHKRMFGASMAAIENYFPLKILANARVDKEEDVNQQNRPDGITTKTGSIIKRRVNNLALDITGADALSVILDHITQMEHWSAYAEWNRDLNTLRTYKRFRNQVINMTTVYGGGRKLWENFNDLCLMAAGEYRPPVSKLNKSAVNLAKGVTAAKVSFRMYTALKQLLSAPAYASEVNMRSILKSIANPYGDFKWCLENMPIFRERWHSRISGDPRLLKSDMDWKMWRSRIMEISSRIGMTPNAFVDAVTVSIGARAMYETRLKQYLKEGYPTDAAEKRALQDATILFNQTQQSSESPFLSTMQVDKDWLSTLFTVFRNSAMSYTRQEFDAMRNLKRNLTPGQQAKSIEFMTKQILRDWDVDPDTATDAERDQAQGAAKKRFRRQIKKDVLRLATFGFILELVWNLGPYLPYMFFGNDEDEKDKMWDDAFTHAYFGSVEGLTGGDVMSSFGNMWASGEWNWNQLSKDMPLASDINAISSKFVGGKNAEAINDILNLLVQMGVGMNPQSITDAAMAITDACGDDPALSHEAALMVMRVLQVPQSQLDKIYFDEIGLSGREARGLSPREIAERYARYKVMRGTPLLPWTWDDEARLGKYEKRAREEIKARFEASEDGEVLEKYKAMEARNTAYNKEVSRAREAMEEDYVKGAAAYSRLERGAEARFHEDFTDLNGMLGEMSAALLQAESAEEAALLREYIGRYRASMIGILETYNDEERRRRLQEMGKLRQEFVKRYKEVRPESGRFMGE